MKTLSGAGELSRGLFLGTVADAAVSHIPFDHAAIRHPGHVFSYASGALALTAGSVKYAQSQPATRARTEALLEIGIGACSFAATQGSLLYPAIGLQAGLAVTRLVVKKRERLQAFGHRAAERAQRSWHNLRDVVRKRSTDTPLSHPRQGEPFGPLLRRVLEQEPWSAQEGSAVGATVARRRAGGT